MAIKVKFCGVEPQPKVKSFPKLMINASSDLVVFFNTQKTGVVLTANKFHKAGDYRDDWVTESFVDYNESITIQNA